MLPFPKYDGADEIIVEFENHKDRGFIPKTGLTFTKWLSQTYPIKDGVMEVPRRVEELVREFFMVMRPRTVEFTQVKVQARTPKREASLEKYVPGSPWDVERDLFFHVFRRFSGFGSKLKKIITKRERLPALLNEVPYYIVLWDMQVDATFNSEIPYPIKSVPGKTEHLKEVLSKLGRRLPVLFPKPGGFPPPGFPPFKKPPGQ